MLTRVSDNMRFKTMVDNLFKVQKGYMDVSEKLASQKRVNRPSDDPIGMSKILDYRSQKASIQQYQDNADSCESWLNMTESKLSSAEDLLIRAREIALSQSSATASEQSRATSAEEIGSIIDELRSLANSKFGDRYLFSGSRTDTAPFSSSESVASIAAPEAASGNTFDGTVASGGTYTGTVNKTYAVKIVDGGALGAATYKVSEDGGRTWESGSHTVPPDGTINIGSEGATLTFTAGSADLAEDDLFYVRASAAGYYRGNGEELSVEVGKGADFNYSISGQSVFTDSGSGTVDVFKSLNDLKTALLNNDASGISAQIDTLKASRDQVGKYTSVCGSRVSSLDITKTNLASLADKLTSMTSDIEDADLSSLITELNMKEIALKATYSVSSLMGNATILNFLK